MAAGPHPRPASQDRTAQPTVLLKEAHAIMVRVAIPGHTPRRARTQTSLPHSILQETAASTTVLCNAPVLGGPVQVAPKTPTSNVVYPTVNRRVGTMRCAEPAEAMLPKGHVKVILPAIGASGALSLILTSRLRLGQISASTPEPVTLIMPVTHYTAEPSATTLEISTLQVDSAATAVLLQRHAVGGASMTVMLMGPLRLVSTMA